MRRIGKIFKPAENVARETEKPEGGEKKPGRSKAGKVGKQCTPTTNTTGTSTGEN